MASSAVIRVGRQVVTLAARIARQRVVKGLGGQGGVIEVDAGVAVDLEVGQALGSRIASLCGTEDTGVNIFVGGRPAITPSPGAGSSTGC